MKLAYAHQLQAAQWLAERRAGLLCDEMGLGKSLSAILACDYVRAHKILVVCPAMVKAHWEREFSECGLSRHVRVIDGSVKTPINGSGVTIVSHDALVKPTSLAVLIASGPWDVLIVDEAHEFRNISSKRTVNLFGLGEYALWRAAKRVWCLTGTPVVNTSVDLYPVMSSILAEQLGWRPTWTEFAERYAYLRPSYTYGSVEAHGVRNHEELYRVLAPHVLRRTLTDVAITLPELRLATFPLTIPDVELTPILADIRGLSPDRYQAMLDQEEEDESISRIRHAVGLAKAPYCAAYVNHLVQSGAWPVVVFYWHHDVMETVRDRLAQNYAVAALNRDTGDSAQVIADFQAGKFAVILVQIKSGGTGITLTRAQRALIIEQPWTAKDLLQAVKRLHRIGQTGSVLAEVAYADGLWFDVLACDKIVQKTQIAEKLIGS